MSRELHCRIDSVHTVDDTCSLKLGAVIRRWRAQSAPLSCAAVSMIHGVMDNGDKENVRHKFV